MRPPAILVGLLLVLRLSRCEILTPPYFNLAEGKEIVASATCGVDTTGPELYCKLVGANADQDEDINLIQGQVGASDCIGIYSKFIIQRPHMTQYIMFETKYLPIQAIASFIVKSEVNKESSDLNKISYMYNKSARAEFFLFPF